MMVKSNVNRLPSVRKQVMRSHVPNRTKRQPRKKTGVVRTSGMGAWEGNPLAGHSAVLARLLAMREE